MSQAACKAVICSGKAKGLSKEIYKLLQNNDKYPVTNEKLIKISEIAVKYQEQAIMEMFDSLDSIT